MFSGLRQTGLMSLAAGCVLGVMTAAALADGRGKVSLIELDGALSDQPAEFSLFGGGKDKTLAGFITQMREATARDDVKAIVVRIKDGALKQSQIEEIGPAIKDARAKGLKVYVFAENYDTSGLLLGSYADQVLLQSGGGVMLPGLYMEEMFLADTLAWAGIKADMVQVGDYKGASEQMSRNAPSPQWDQNIDSLLDSMYANMRSKLKDGRSMTDEGLDAAMKAAWMTDGDAAAKTGLVDTQVDLPLLKPYVEKAAGETLVWAKNEDSEDAELKAAMSNPIMMLAKLMEKPDHSAKAPAIAVLHIGAEIVDGDSGGGGMFSSSSVGSRTIRNAIEDMLDDPMVKGVVVRIDSPGGSAIASEVIWQGLKRLAEKKPVWGSVGSMAASGGYYIASGTSKIYVNPSSIVGSIGVVGGRMSLTGLYEKLHVNVKSRTRGPMAGMFRSTAPWTPEELAAVRTKMTETYNLFTSRVTAGRPGIDLAKTAEGRLFTGDKAIGLKMADQIGGLEVAIKDLAKTVGVEDPEIVHYPAPKTLEDLIQNTFGKATTPDVSGKVGIQAAESIIKEVVGERNWPQVRSAMNGLLQLRKEPVVLMNPSVLITE